jgi:cytochrome c biogenesis protein CcmG/thiol:disulfide interchange protein DsbE
VIRFLLPLGALAGLLGLLFVGLSLNPREIPSPLVGKPVPEFSLPRLRFPDQQITHLDLRGKVSLLNFWATWCVGCRTEHPLLLQIANSTDVPIYGIDYKDQHKPALDWLQTLGDPYVASGYDAEGRMGLDLGVYGLPETFVVDVDGRIAYKHIGPITAADWKERILPEVQKLRERAR